MKNAVAHLIKEGSMVTERSNMISVSFAKGFETAIKEGDAEEILPGYMEEWSKKAESVVNLVDKEAGREVLVYLFPDHSVGIIDWSNHQVISADVISVVRNFVITGSHLND